MNALIVFWFAGTSLECLGKFVYQGHRVNVKVTRSQKHCLYVLFVCGLPLIERQSCYWLCLVVETFYK